MCKLPNCQELSKLLDSDDYKKIDQIHWCCKRILTPKNTLESIILLPKYVVFWNLLYALFQIISLKINTVFTFLLYLKRYNGKKVTSILTYLLLICNGYFKTTSGPNVTYSKLMLMLVYNM